MIKAEELRIGNVIGYQDSDYANSQDEIHFTGPVVSVNKVVISVGDHITGTTLVSPQEAIPIPVTPEILEKCGFKSAKHDPTVFAIKGIGDKGFAIVLHQSHDYYWLNQPAAQKFYFLHQIQNLYFALTGEELTIKELAK